MPSLSESTNFIYFQYNKNQVVLLILDIIQFVIREHLFKINIFKITRNNINIPTLILEMYYKVNNLLLIKFKETYLNS